MVKAKEHKYIFKMLKAALFKTDIEKCPDLDWKYIHKLCEFHKIDNIIGYLSNDVLGMPTEIYQKFLMAKNICMAREVVQNHELMTIQNLCKLNNIKTLALKGSILKKYYPSEDIRFLTDLDILFEEGKSKDVNRLLNELGYEFEHGGGHHDVYIKKPYMTVEMHYSCYCDNDVLNEMFSDIWSRCIQKDKCVYEMTWDDFYLFMLGHMAKHFIFGGVGIRMLLDFVIFDEKLSDKCDNEYIEKILKKAGLYNFNLTLKKLIKKCFYDDYMFDDNDILVDCILNSGAYGTQLNNLNMKILGEEKSSITMNRMLMLKEICFPKLRNMKIKYQYLEALPFLLPVAWLQRGVSKFFKQRREFIKIIKRPFNKNGVRQLETALQQFGIKGEKNGIL